MTERRGSDSSISFHQFSGFAFLFMDSYSMWCNRPRMALDGRKSTYLRHQVHVIFLTNTSRGPCFLCFESPRLQTHSFIWWACHWIACAPERCLLLRPCRQALFGKGDRQVAFCPEEISKNDHMPERYAALVGLAPSATAIDSTARFWNLTS